MNSDLGQMSFWLAVGLIGLGVTFGPIGKAIARTVELSVEAVLGRLFGGHQRSLREELGDIDGRLADVERMQQRLIEVEERVDFTERLLTSDRPAPGPDVDTPPEPAAAAR